MDPALALLLPQIRAQRAPALWVLDEHGAGGNSGVVNEAVTIVSNRFDVAGEMERAGWSTRFSDFDFSAWADGSLEAIFLRLAKEKPVVHHIVNAAARLLAPGGRLLLSGGKQQGIKSYARGAAQRLGGAVSVAKHGAVYLAAVRRGEGVVGPPLDDRDYDRLRPVAEQDGVVFLSKPGLYGWDKIDAGSALLVDYLAGQGGAAPASVCDLGCGYGYLALHAQRLYRPARLLATDNNAAALAACRENLRRAAAAAEVVAADCAAGINERFALVLCNPPFHQGFEVERDLTERFAAAARRLCADGGVALFVTNAFIPIERAAAPHFARVEAVAGDGRYKILRLTP